jgi:hypothetical protein
VIDESRVEGAVEFLRDTAKQYGQARGYMAFAEGNLRRIKSLELLAAEGSLGEREAKAYASPRYLEALQDLQNATAEYETLRARRESAAITVDVWRSQNAARRQGAI